MIDIKGLTTDQRCIALAKYSNDCLQQAFPNVSFNFFKERFATADGWFQKDGKKALVETKHRRDSYETIKSKDNVFLEMNKILKVVAKKRDQGYDYALYILTYEGSRTASVLDLERVLDLIAQKVLVPQVSCVPSDHTKTSYVNKKIVRIPLSYFLEHK